MSNTSISKRALRLEGIIDEQEQLLASLRRELDDIDTDGILNENEMLKDNISRAQQENERLKSDNEKLSRQLEAAKASLFARMANEKLSVFTKTQKQLESIYYTDNIQLQSRLEAYRKNCLHNVELMRKKVEGFSQEGYDDLLCTLKDLDAQINQRHTELTQRLNAEQSAMIDANNAAGAKLRNEKLTETEKRTAVKQKNIESFIGLNVLSKAGILLFIIGIIALGRFAYVHLPDMFKGIMIFALGGVLIGAGELFYKKEKTIFSTALISGGVAVLYAAAATSYFALELFSVRTTFVLCIVITAIAILISMQVKNQVVCAFAAVGGYLPLVATFMIGFGDAAADKAFMPVSAVYFIMLAAVIFVMTYNKKWYVAQYIGYVFQLFSILGIARSAWVLKDAVGYGYALVLAAGFAAASFLIYLLMPSVRIVGSKEITTSDIVLMGLNTISGAVSIGITISNCFTDRAAGNRASGIAFLVLTLIYAVIAKVSSGKATKSYNSVVMSAVLYSALLALSLLIVPFVFGWQYVGIAWAAEGSIIAVIAIEKEKTPFEIAGFICMLASAVVFGGISAYREYGIFTPIIIVSITIIMLSLLGYIIFALSKSKDTNVFYIIVEVIMAILSALYLVYVYKYTLHLPFIKYFCEFTDMVVYALIVATVSIMFRLGVMKNSTTDLTALIFRAFMLLLVIFKVDAGIRYNDITLFYGNTAEVKWLIILNLVLLIAVNLISAALLSKSVTEFINRYELPAWIFTAVISVSSLVLITSMLMGQFNVKFSNVLISAVYIATACVLLFIGFAKRFTVVRTGGLVLILAALAKLCFVDTHALNTGWKIGAYFAFGAILIIISFFYQRFNKKLAQEAAAEYEMISEENQN